MLPVGRDQVAFQIGIRIVGSALCIGALILVGQQIRAHVDLGRVEAGIVYGGLTAIGVAGNALIWIPWLMERKKAPPPPPIEPESTAAL